ncbi:hypothetical protein [Thalassospira sp.]|uniref:hypothetical protein n=1 Tax=Thalassospira sp. TaxID=1912094 RepID=UPI00273598E8|nr:hypothetical protein [Thalassospira sp.]MDP2697595.1 hypothetical protein [Thalassospira sp.]
MALATGCGFGPENKLPITLFLSMHPKRKNPQGVNLAGFSSGRICPVDFSLMPQPKEQIKNFFRKKAKNFCPRPFPFPEIGNPYLVPTGYAAIPKRSCRTKNR